MSNLKSRWEQISEEDREETLENKYGWILRNLLKYGNTLVPGDAIRRNSIAHISKSLEHDLYVLGFDTNITITKHEDADQKNIDYIAEAEFLNGGERNGKRSVQKNKRRRKVL